MSNDVEKRSYIGDDGWGKLAHFLDANFVKSVLLVTGNSAYSSSGAEVSLGIVLKDVNVRRVYEFQTNPKADDVVQILSSIKSDRTYDAIITIGGGSVIDMGKLLKAFWHSDNPVSDYLKGVEDLVPADVPLVAIPTTAGSGSEATHFAVVYQGKQKFSVAHEKLLPDYAVVIPTLLQSLPKSVAASSGMDALCQAIESYWSIYSTEQSLLIAKEAMSLAWSSMTEAVNERTPQSLEKIARASHLAGVAINITKTTAPHAVSYALTSFYNIPHGHAVGLLTPHFLTYNMEVNDTDCIDPRGSEWVRSRLKEVIDILGCKNASEGAEVLIQRLNEIGLESDLSRLGVESSQDIEVILKNGFNPERVNNNPRRLTEQGLMEMLKKMIKER